MSKMSYEKQEKHYNTEIAGTTDYKHSEKAHRLFSKCKMACKTQWLATT